MRKKLEPAERLVVAAGRSSGGCGPGRLSWATG
jgi:hypothetical protein